MSKDKAKAKKEWKELHAAQVSDSLLWEATKRYTSYITKNNGLTLSLDPMNLTGLNTKKDSGIASVRSLGIEYDISERNVKYKKKKEKRPVVRFSLNIKTKKLIPKKKCVELKDPEPSTNHCIYSQRNNITIRAIVKALRRDLHNYRRDLVHTALRRLYKLYRFKKLNKHPKKEEDRHKK